ncbi:MAG: hypothetical protein V7722_06210, partial [Porticoccus sp.]
MIEEIYTEALLAAAAYADWGSGDVTEIKAELINERGFTEEQYNTFFDLENGLYEVYGGPSSGYVESANGFSATIFENRATGELTVAFRGTEPEFPYVDVLADIVALLGFANPDGPLEDFFNQTNNIDDFLDSNNLLSNDQLTQPVNFTGHSLGGYLATMSAYKYSSSFGEAYTYNGLGLTPLENAWEDFKSTFVGRPLDDTKIHNYFADKGWEAASSPLLSRPGGQEAIFIEEVSNPASDENHAIAKLVESLSVYRVLALLDPNLDSESGFNTIYKVLDAATNVADQSLETIIDQLGALFGGVLETDAIKSDIELFYQTVETAGNNYSIEAVTGYIADRAAENTQTGRGYRYALVNLLPFVITGDLTGTVADDVVYDLYDGNGDRLYSDAYLADKAKMLGHVVNRNTLDADYPSIGVEGESIYYGDRFTGESFVTGQIDLPGGAPAIDEFKVKRVVFGSDSDNAFLLGGEKDDRLYGQGGNDTLSGQAGNDYIEGGTGDDTITGGAGSDTLIGGAGKDTFVFNSGDGFDIVKGGDITGDRILLNGDDLGTLAIDPIPRLGEGALSSAEEAMYLDEKGNIYLHDPYAETLRIIAADSTNNFIFLENYVPSAAGVALELRTDYGIQLPERVSIESIPVGGFTDASAEGESSGFYPVFYYESDSSSSTHDFVYVSDFSAGNPAEWTNFGLISTFGGDDFIALSSNPDESNYAATELVGGRGSDTIYGAAGHDALFATEVNVPEGEALDDPGENNSLFGGAGFDILIGASYDDLLVAGDDEDWVFAGTGNDIIYGGWGSDYILADSFMSENTEGILFHPDYVAQQYNYGRPDFSVNGDLQITDHDVIDGGYDADYIEGGRGNDTIFGGSGSDVISGDRMNTPEFWKTYFNEEVRFPTQDYNWWSSAYMELDPTLHGDDVIDGGDDGTDRIFGNGGSDIITGAGYIQGDDYFISGEHHKDDVIYLTDSSSVEGNGG